MKHECDADLPWPMVTMGKRQWASKDRHRTRPCSVVVLGYRGIGHHLLRTGGRAMPSNDQCTLLFFLRSFLSLPCVSLSFISCSFVVAGIRETEHVTGFLCMNSRCISPDLLIETRQSSRISCPWRGRSTPDKADREVIAQYSVLCSTDEYSVTATWPRAGHTMV